MTMNQIAQSHLSEMIIYNFQMIPSLRKKIFLYIQFLLQKFKRAFPSMERIAEICRCSVITVKRAIKWFAEVGWLTKWKRCYRSSEYRMEPEIIALDLTKNRTFRNHTFTRGSDTVGDTILDVAKSDKIILRKEELPVVAEKSATQEDDVIKLANNRKAFNQRVKRYCPSRTIEIDDISLQSLLKNFIVGKPEGILINALEGLESAKKPIVNPVGWLFKMCSYWKNKTKAVNPS